MDANRARPAAAGEESSSSGQPQEAASGAPAERFGPLQLRSLTKADGRALIVYQRDAED